MWRFRRKCGFIVSAAQHGSGSGLAGSRGNGQLPANPTDYRPLLRALLVALDAWVRQGREPPASQYPRVSDGTLVGWREAESGWLPLAGVRYPEVINQPELFDRGPDFLRLRRTSIEPPISRGHYVVKVARYDDDDNERGTLRVRALAVPIGTYTGWNLRDRSIGAENELLGLSGGYIPLARTVDERSARGDPRPALLRRYRDFADYRRRHDRGRPAAGRRSLFAGRGSAAAGGRAGAVPAVVREQLSRLIQIYFCSTGGGATAGGATPGGDPPRPGIICMTVAMAVLKAF